MPVSVPLEDPLAQNFVDNASVQLTLMVWISFLLYVAYYLHLTLVEEVYIRRR